MKNKKILLIFIMTVIILMATMNSAYAASFNVKLSTDKQNYAPGQTVTVTVALDDIVSDYGINGLSGRLYYDTNAFEDFKSETLSSGLVKTIGITGLNEWKPLYNGNAGPDKGLFSIYADYPTERRLEIMKIELKVKEGATLGKANIMLTELVGAENGDLETLPASIDVNIKNPSDIGTEIPPITTTPSPTPSTTPSPVVTPSAGTITVTTTTTPKATPTPTGHIPQTGLNDFMVPALIGGTVIIALVAYVAYRRYKNF